MAWENFIDDLKIQIDIVDVIGREVNLKKSGSNYMGLCPFHSEKTPSFSVNEEKQFYHCFGCGESGDVIKFVQNYYKLSFMESVEKLAADYGIRMPERHSGGPRIDYDKYYEINAKAARFFYNSLGRGGGAKGLAYLKSRGLTKETITKFGLGYAPDSGYELTKHLIDEGVSEDDILKLGLANRGRNGLYDRFRDRVMFPIINTHDKVIGFGGRAIGDIKPKYLNSAESEIFLKKNNLFGLNFGKRAIADENRAIIVEGYMDVISLYQAGIHNVTASLGTALTDNQARLLCRYSKNIVLSYDSDQAGINAALRGISVVSGAGGKPRVMTVTDGKDPDEFVKKHGKEAFLRLADNAVPATDFRLKLAAEGMDLTDDRQILEYVEKVVPVLRSLGPVEQDIYVRRLSSQLGVSENAIMMAVRTEEQGSRTPQSARMSRREIRGSRSGHQSRQQQDAGSISGRIEMSMLVLAMNNIRYIRRFTEDGIRFRSALANKILSVMDSFGDELSAGVHRIEIDDIAAALEPDEERIFRGIAESIQIGPDDEAFYRELKDGYMINQYREELAEVRNELAVAEKIGHEDEVIKLLGRQMELDKLINNLTEVNNAG